MQEEMKTGGVQCGAVEGSGKVGEVSAEAGEESGVAAREAAEGAALDKLHVDPKTRLRLDHLIALLRLNHATSASVAAPIVPAAPENPPTTLPASQKPCSEQGGTSETR
ncbi:hypothetical protein JCM10213v2_001485 [Rhodosporidiobolus nylandii]